VDVCTLFVGSETGATVSNGAISTFSNSYIDALWLPPRRNLRQRSDSERQTNDGADVGGLTMMCKGRASTHVGTWDGDGVVG
jgi:hypothetical protein